MSKKTLFLSITFCMLFLFGKNAFAYTYQRTPIGNEIKNPVSISFSFTQQEFNDWIIAGNVADIEVHAFRLYIQQTIPPYNEFFSNEIVDLNNSSDNNIFTFNDITIANTYGVMIAPYFNINETDLQQYEYIFSPVFNGQYFEPINNDIFNITDGIIHCNVNSSSASSTLDSLACPIVKTSTDMAVIIIQDYWPYLIVFGLLSQILLIALWFKRFL